MAIVLMAIPAFALTASAHAPEEMTLYFNDGLDLLTVKIRHDVKDRTTHYIESIQIHRNGIPIAEETYEEQPRGTFMVRFSVDAGEGDVIKVLATCNLMGDIEREMEIGSGITEAGDDAGTLQTVMYIHMAVHSTAVVLAFIAMPGGMGFYFAWRRKSRPKGRRKMHARIGMAAAILWGLGCLSGLYITSITSGDYFGSLHGWFAFSTVIAAAFAGYTASPRFKKAGYGARLQAHTVTSALTIVLALVASYLGLTAAGIL
jgi:uncharacterized membrane protein YozB (DUF420 family)